MSGDLDDVIGGVGVRLREVGDDDFVDASRNFRVTRFDELPEDCPSRLQIMLEPQHGISDFARLRPGNAHHADAATAGWRGDGDDRIVKVHRAIVAGEATTFSISAFSWP